MRQVVFATNPVGVRHLGLLHRRCREAAGAHGWEPRFIVTEAAEASSQFHDDLSGYAAGAGDKLVFAVGGDGTVRACAHDLAGTGVALAIVPRGTANLFAKALGIPVELGQALQAGFGGGERLVDLAMADGSPFVAMAGIGIDAAVVHGTPRLLKEQLGWLGYAVSALPHLAGPHFGVEIRLDGAEPLVRQARAVVVGNVGTLPGGFTLLPGARVDDGLLDVGVLAPTGLAGWAVVARRAVVGKPSSKGGQFEHFRASEVEVSASSELWRQIDGDLMGRGRALSVRVRHQALLVRVPAVE
jgi:undecaprenyl-diphosphatase